jgi:predicted transcriptional regulator with HTH domain
LGYRASEAGLLYLNIFYDVYSYVAALSSNQFTTINTSGHSINKGILVGAQSNWNSFVSKVEAGVVEAKLNEQDSLTSGSFGVTLGWGW